jgi:hypothetical protein
VDGDKRSFIRKPIRVLVGRKRRDLRLNAIDKMFQALCRSCEILVGDGIVSVEDSACFETTELYRDASSGNGLAAGVACKSDCLK